MKLRFTIFLLMVHIGANCQVTMTTTGSYSQNFNTLSSTTAATPTWTDNSTIGSWYGQRTGSGTTYIVGTGASNTGGLYSFGSTSAVDRALGTVGSGTPGSMAVGLLLRNTSGNVITNLTVAYTGEQWRDGSGATSPQVMTFWYRTSSSAITALTPNNPSGWTSVTALNFSSPIFAGANTALDGNLAANKTIISAVAIPSLSLADNDYIMLKWDDPDHTGSDHGLSIDDVTVSWTAAPLSPPAVSSASLSGTVGSSFSYNIVATNPPIISYAIASGTLPAGLTFNTTTGLISGTPSAATTTSIDVTATNAAGTSAPATISFTITSPPVPVVTPSSQTGVVGTSFSYNVVATNSPTSYSIVGGTLPPGLSFNNTTGLISGTPSSSGSYSIFVRATNAGGNSASATISFTISLPAAPVVTGSSQFGTVGTPFSYNIVASNSPTGYTLASGTLPPGLSLNTTTGAITGTPSSSGSFSVTVTATNAGGTSAPATISFTISPGAAPEINLKGIVGSNPSIADGDITPQGTDNTLFASTVVGSASTKNFRIQNIGTADLTVSSISFTGANPGDFSASGITLPITIVAGNSQDFAVTFTPIAAGTRTAVIQINNTDSDESIYDFVVQGSATALSLIEMNVKGNGNSIPDNSLYPNGINFTAFGVATVGVTTVTRVFTIENLGTNTLTLSGTPRVTISGTHASMFSVTIQPSATVAGGANTTFTVVFNPTSLGAKNAVISISNDDSDENPYNFNISGNAKGASNIYVYGNGNDVIKGAVTTSVLNNTDFGATAITTGLKQNTFVVTNYSGGTRYFGSVSISGADASMFSIVSQITTAALADGNTTTFTINFTPTSIGIKNATVTFNTYTNAALTTPDAVDPSFSFAVSGYGENFSPCSVGSVMTILTQNFEDTPATPTWGYTYLTDGSVNVIGGTYDNGSGARPAYIDNKSLQFTGIGTGTLRTTTISLAAVDLSQYNNINFSFRVGAFRTGSQGVDIVDFVEVQSSVDGVNWSSEAVLKGFNNARWDFNATGVFNAYYTGNNNGATIDARNGNADLPGGYSTYNVRSLPSAPNLLIRIVLGIDRNDEIWAIDNVLLQGQVPNISTWTGGTWIGGIPTNTTKAIIDDTYDTGTNGSITACECQINAGKVLTVSPGVSNNYMEIEGKIVNNGTLNRTSGGVIIQKNSAATNFGNANISRETSPYEKYDYVYWAAPVYYPTITPAFSGWRTDYSFSFNTINFQDIITASTGLAPSDGFDDAAPFAWTNTGTSAQMIPGKGYAIMTPTAGSFPTTSTVTFTGMINNGTISIPLDLSANNADTGDDYNLIGNPYPSEIDANAFISRNTSNMSGTLYFWTHKADISSGNPGPNTYNFISADYATLTIFGGTASATGSLAPNRYVPSEQGFFVEASNSASVFFTNDMRRRNFTSVFFRNSIYSNVNEDNGETDDKVWLNLEGPENLFSQQLVGYSQNTSIGVDNGYDGAVFKSPNTVSFYSTIENAQYRIQARGPFNIEDQINFGYSSKFEGSLTIKIDKMEGRFLQDTPIYLEDKLLNIIHNLKQSSYTFTTGIGQFDNRFILRYNDSNLGTATFGNTANSVAVVSGKEAVKIKSYTEKMSQVTIYDVLGRTIFEKNEVNDKDISIPLAISQQTLIVKIKLENGQEITKKIIY